MLDTYEYRARDKGGHVLDGTIEAENAELVVSRLREMGYLPVSITKKGGAGLKRDITIPFLSGRTKPGEVAVFCRQFATIISSGLTLLRALNILVAQTENKAFSNVINLVRIDIERGTSLSAALAKHPKVFDRLFVAMVRSGESGGVLDDVLLRLADSLEKQVAIKRKIKSAMTYPAAVLGMSVGILAAMLLFVVPTFKAIFASLHGSLPLPTRILLAVSHIVVTYFVFVVIVVAALVFAFFKYKATRQGRDMLDRLILKIPIFGKLFRKYAMVRFSRTLAALLRSGVPVLRALDITKEAAGNVKVSEGITDMEIGVTHGEPLAHRMVRHEIFPPMMVQMVSVGEETGGVDDMLDKVAGFYEQEVDAMVAALSSLLEPVLIVFLGGIVGSMVVSLYLPMFNVIKLIH